MSEIIDKLGFIKIKNFDSANIVKRKKINTVGKEQVEWETKES